MSERVPDLLVEQLALGELDEARAAAVRARLEAEPGGLARLEALAQSDAAIREAIPPRVAAAAIRQRMTQRRNRRLFTFGLELAVIALLGAIFMPPILEPGVHLPGVYLDPQDGATRIKGLDPQLHIHRRGDGETLRLDDGAPARAGERLQLTVAAAGAPYGAVFSIDGWGVVTLHLPEQLGDAVALPSGGAQELPHSYELDDAPSFERFFLVTGVEPFPVAPLLRAAEGLEHPDSDPLPVPNTLAVTSVTLHKETR
ncbi:MAG: hypothetical protein H6739_22560 [Alphaproteobacteria bacterium]|nr:hypothetical protein [Alphaproteobacteria bacterium]